VDCLVDPSVLDVPDTAGDSDDEPDIGQLRLLQEAEEVQEDVRRRVKPQRWEAYWRIAIRGEDVGETAADLGISYAAAYAATRYVDRMLRDAGRRRSEGRVQDD